MIENTLQLWHFLINGKDKKQNGIYANFYSYGQHLGDALEHTLHATTKYGIKESYAVEAECLGVNSGFKFPQEVIKVTKYALINTKVETYLPNTAEKTFIPPIGIIKSNDNEALKYDLIKEGFIAYNDKENETFELELVINRDKLVDTFFKLLHHLPTVDGFWIYLWNKWDNRKTELWVDKKMVHLQEVIDFLQKNKNSTIENGFIACVIHSAIGETNITLDEYKKIKLTTKDEELFDFIGAKVIQLGFKQIEDFYSLEHGFNHLNYRPYNSLNRDDFKNLLDENGFELLDIS